MKRRVFDREFKLAAVKKVVVQGLSFTQVARELGIRDTYIHSWKKTFEADGSISSKTEANASDSTEEENKRLRDKIRRLEMECEILKKATAYFAKENL